MTEQNFSYSGVPVLYSGKFDSLEKIIRDNDYSRVFIITDKNCKKYCWPVLRKELSLLKKAEVIVIKGGERNKNWDNIERITDILTDNNADRKSLLVNLGGGIATDTGGFAAAIYKRGIDYVNIPTSLLGMVDAAIGSKTGVDFNAYKNQLGAIYHPKAVIVNPVFLQTLPFKDVMSGLAETIKHSLTDGKAHYDLVRKNVAEFKLEPIIISSLQFKTSIVQQDLYEQNLRKVLNFGHTAGHAIETLLIERGEKVKHGECVVYGMVTALELSRQVYKQKENKWSEIIELLRKYYPVLPLKKQDLRKLLKIMKQDKKNVKGSYRFVLLKDIGSPEIGVPVDEKSVTRALEYAIETMKI